MPRRNLPEQATPGADVDARGDVYGLGAILYHALTGRPPFHGQSPADVLVQVRERQPIAAYRIDQARQTAQQEARKARQNLYFAQVRLADRALSDGNPGHTARLLEQWIPTMDSDDDLREWEWHYLWNQVKSDAAFELGRHDSLIRSVAFSPNAARAASSDFAGGVAIWDIATRERIAHFTQPGIVNEVLFFSDTVLLTAGGDGYLGFYDLEKANFVQTVDLDFPVRAIALSRDRGQLAALCGQEDIPAQTHLWKLGQPTPTEPVASLELHHTIQSPRGGWWAYLGGAVALSPSGQEVAVGDVDGTVRLYSWTTGERLFTLGTETTSGGITTLAFSSDGKSLVSQGTGGQISEEAVVWNVATGDRTAGLPGHRAGVRELAFSPNGNWLIVGGADQLVQQWGTSTWVLHRTFAGNRSQIHALSVAPVGGLALSGDNDGILLAWDMAQPSRRIEPFTITGCRSLQFSPSGSLVATVEPLPDQPMAFRANLRRAANLGDRTELPALGDDVLDLAFAQDESQLAALATGAIRLWDLRDNHVARTANLPASNSRLLIGFKGTAAVWDVKLRRLRGHLTGHSIWRVEPAISADGRSIATLGQDGDRQVRLWNAQTLEQTATLQTPPHLINGPSISNNGRRVAISHHRFAAAGIYDSATGAQLLTLPLNPPDSTLRTEWSPDGTSLALHGSDTTVWRLPAITQK